MIAGIRTSLRGQGSTSQKNIKIFGLLLLAYEAIIVIFYAIFARYYPLTPKDSISPLRWVAFQDIEVMVVVGFGCLMAFVKGYSISVLVYTLFLNAILIQGYPLFNNLAGRLIMDEFTSDSLNSNVYLSVYMLLQCCGCVAAQLIAYCAVLGRVGPKDIMIMGNFCMLGYCFNEILVQDKIMAQDSAGTLFIHLYGGVFGLTTSWFLSRKKKPVQQIKSSQTSLIIASIGTLMLWVYWPSFNFGGTANNQYEQILYAYSTLLALIGSCVMTFIITSLLGKKMIMQDILNATLAGGVSIGVVNSMSYLPVTALLIGLAAGLISTLGFHYLTPYCQRKIGLYDTCGILNLHVTPSIFGGLVSAMVVASYNSGFDTMYTDGFWPGNIWQKGNYSSQAWKQIGGTFCSIGMGILTGIICGLVMSCFYDEKASSFFTDTQYFNVEEPTNDSRAIEERSLLENE